MHGHSITPWPLSNRVHLITPQNYYWCYYCNFKLYSNCNLNMFYSLPAMYFRSQPVFNVTARLLFQPKELSTDLIDCLSNKGEILPMGTLTVCLKGVETTKSKAGRNLTQKCNLLIAANTTSYHCYFNPVNLAACIFRFTNIWTKHFGHTHCGCYEANISRFHWWTWQKSKDKNHHICAIKRRNLL